MFERFTDGARRIVVLAQEEARMLNHDYIGTEHLLLGLIHEEEGLAAKAMVAMDISLGAVRGQVEEIIGRGEALPTGHIPFTPRAKKVLELSLREALQLGHNYIGTEHILLGLLREGEGVAAQVLRHLGADVNRIRHLVNDLMSNSVGYVGRAGRAGLRSTAFGEIPETRMAERADDLRAIEELAAEEAAQLGHSTVGAAHRWLGYMRLRIEEARGDLERLTTSLQEGRLRVAEQWTDAPESPASPGGSKEAEPEP